MTPEVAKLNKVFQVSNRQINTSVMRELVSKLTHNRKQEVMLWGKNITIL